MKLPRRTFLQLAASAAALPPLSSVARAQAYPTRPVRLRVGFTAGPTDFVAAGQGSTVPSAGIFFRLHHSARPCVSSAVAAA